MKHKSRNLVRDFVVDISSGRYGILIKMQNEQQETAMSKMRSPNHRMKPPGLEK
jgi:uncharacterized protein YbjQ (UPF0145 family)